MRVKDLPEISKLSTPEKILLVEDLWTVFLQMKPLYPYPEAIKQNSMRVLNVIYLHPATSFLLTTFVLKSKSENELYSSFFT